MNSQSQTDGVQPTVRTSNTNDNTGGMTPRVTNNSSAADIAAMLGMPTIMKRKRQGSCDQSGDTSGVVSCDSPAAGDLERLHVTCSALLVKSQCYRAMKRYSVVEELLDEVLDRMKWLMCAGQLDGSDEKAELERQAKRRKIDEGK